MSTPAEAKREESKRLKESIIAAARTGESYVSIAIRLCVHPNTVWRTTKTAGIKRRKRSPTTDDKHRAEIIAAARDGEQYASIAQRYGMSATKVSRIALAADIRRKPFYPAPNANRIVKEVKNDANHPILEALRAGESCSSIGRRFGLGKEAVGRMALAANIPIRRPMKREKPGHEVLSELIAAAKAGEPYVAIGRRLGMTAEQVSGHALAAGIDRYLERLRKIRDLYQEVIEAAQGGESYTSISKRLGLDKKTIKRMAIKGKMKLSP